MRLQACTLNIEMQLCLLSDFIRAPGQKPDQSQVFLRCGRTASENIEKWQTASENTNRNKKIENTLQIIFSSKFHFKSIGKNQNLAS